MYTLEGAPWIIKDGVRQEPAPTRTFATAMGMLHWVHAQGFIRTRVTDTPLEDVHVPYSGSGDWKGPYRLTLENEAALKRAHARYRAILRYLREVEPKWTEVPGSRVSYADNSVEAVEADKYGRTRRVMLEYPHGDRCF